MIGHEWSVKWQIVTNANKSTTVLIHGQKRKPTAGIDHDGELIQWADRTKYFDVVDKNLIYNDHIEEVIKKLKYAKSKLNTLKDEAVGSIYETN